MRDGNRAEHRPIRTVMKAIERATRIRARQTRPPMAIESCGSGPKCPGRWSALTDDGRLDSRSCGTCGRRVHLCVSNKERREKAAIGHPVVFYRDLWPCGHDALRARSAVLEGRAPPEVQRQLSPGALRRT